MVSLDEYNRGHLAIPMGHMQMLTHHVINMDLGNKHTLVAIVALVAGLITAMNNS